MADTFLNGDRHARIATGRDPTWLMPEHVRGICRHCVAVPGFPATYYDPGREPTPRPRNCLGMGMTKAIRKQAVTAEKVAAQTADTFVADQMKSLAEAFRAQAEVLKKKKKKKK